jgi:hypothetical protein
MHFEPILSLEKQRKFTESRVLLCKFEPKNSQIIMQILDKFPFEFNHLKRIKRENKKNLIIVCEEESILVNEMTFELKRQVEECEFLIGIVPKYQAKTISQYEEWRRIWPMALQVDPRQ